MTTFLHPGYGHPVTRAWQGNDSLEPERIIYPLFLSDDSGKEVPIKALPGVSRYSVDRLGEVLPPLVKAGLKSVLLFGVVGEDRKDDTGSYADAEGSPVVRGIKYLRQHFPDLMVICDVCMCGYTSHGHCGILQPDGTIQNAKSIKRLGEIGCAYIRAGAHSVAPSDMMDCRIDAIQKECRDHGVGGNNNVNVISYASKFASCMYGPFREAAASAPAFGDRKCYQLPPKATGLALRAVKRDIEEGSTAIIVKPVAQFLDIVAQAREFAQVPIIGYQVSGEYAMLYHAAKAGAFDFKTAVMESFTCMRRAGCDAVITYYAPNVLLDKWDI